MALTCSWCQDRFRHTRRAYRLEFASQEKLFKHVESIHHEPVRREWETIAQALERYRSENPTAYPSTACRCQNCRNRWSAVLTTKQETHTEGL